MYAPNREEQIEQEASDADDMLALYESAKGELIQALSTLARGDGKGNTKTLIVSHLYMIEQCIFAKLEMNQTGDATETAELVVDIVDDKPKPEELNLAAGQLIDDYFHRYLVNAKEMRGW